MKMCFFAFPPCNDPSCSCPQTSSTTRGPVERKCAVLNHFPDTRFSELEQSWQRQWQRWIAGCSRSSPTLQSRVSTRAGVCLSREAAPRCFTRALLLQDPSLTARGSLGCFQLSPCSGLCGALVLQWDGNALQCFALHLKNLWGKPSLKRRKTNPLFIFRGLQQYPTIYLRNSTQPPFHKTIEL